MKLIIGLGNPGKEYEKTRHNIGFMTIDNYLGPVDYQEKFRSNYYKSIIGHEVVYFLKPLTYMNLSGQAIQEFVHYFNIDIEDILVIQDDLDLNFGTYKLKKNSSSGGHNGIKSIIKELGTDSFLRLKIGINNKSKNNVIDFVLSRFTQEELAKYSEMTKIYDEIINSFILKGATATINKYNTK